MIGGAAPDGGPDPGPEAGGGSGAGEEADAPGSETEPPFRVRSRDRRHLAALWFAAVVWLVLSAPLALFVLPDGWRRGEPWAWLLLLFFLVGVWLLVQAVRRTLSWRRFGSLTLRLDPAPGSLGGHVGGEVRIPVRSYGRSDYDVTLSCIRVERRGRGSDARTWESVLWTRTGTPAVEREGRGVLLRFTFEVPEEVPPSESFEDGEHRWTVRLVGRVPGLDLDTVFEVPVHRHPEPRHADSPVSVSSEGEEDVGGGLPPRVVRAEPVREGVRLHYPPGRDLGTGTLLLVFGLVFGGLPMAFGRGVLGDLAAGASDAALVFLVFGGAIFGVFVLVGAGLTSLGLYTLANTLTVTLGRERITSVRRVLGVPLRSSAPVHAVESVELSIHGQVGQGARARARFDIRAFPAGGRRLVLGDGIPGPELAERIARLVERETGLDVDRVPRDRRTSSVARARERDRDGS